MALHEMVQTAARLYPERRAVCFDACNHQIPVSYMYKTVMSLATELTDFLRKHCNLTENLEIGLYCNPGINLPSWILGLLQVPAAYSPIDPDALPSLYISFMKKCGFQYILVEEDKVDKFTITYGHLYSQHSLQMRRIGLILFQSHSGVQLTKYVNADSESSVVRSICKEQQHDVGAPKDLLDVREKHSLAYVLHTSGTTGLPKIVRVPHKCIVPNILHLRELFKITPDDVVFMASPLTFDPSVIDLFISLASGACLLILPTVIKMMPQQLSRALFQKHRVTVLQATPTLLKRFGVEHIRSSVLTVDTSLRILALGGEACPALSVLRSWKEKGNKTQLFNIYGITEVSCWATCYRIPEEAFDMDHRFDSPVPLGIPLSGTAVEVKDANGLLVQEGEGQVFIGGNGRVCFIDGETTLPVDTMRATGDFVKVKNAEMFFLGRKDNQIKRHGKRLNTEYVQQVAESLCTVETCALIWYQQEKLILFVAPKAVSKRHLFKKLQERLPSYAIPDEVLLIDTLPFTSHGKIDVSELNQIYSSHLNSRKSDSKLSEEELWQGLQSLWQAILNLPDGSSCILEESQFLPSGGDSLKLLQLHDEIERMVGRPVPDLVEIILNHSISEIYKHILKSAFPRDNLTISPHSAVKRKPSDPLGEEPNNKYVELTPENSLKTDVGPIGFIAVSRGNHLVSINEPVKNQIEAEPAEKDEVSPDSDTNLNITEDYSAEGNLDEANLGEVTQKLTLHVRWTSDLGKCVDASPLLVIPVPDRSSALVYIGSHSHVVQAIGLHSGKVKWTRSLAGRIESSACVSKCGNFIVVGCYNGLVYVLQNSNGEVHWAFPTQDAVKSSPALDPSTGLVFIGSHDQHIYALDIYKKECVWRLHSESGGIFSSPHLHLFPHHLYVGTLGGLLLAVNPVMGKTVWKTICGKPIFSSPHCDKDYVYVGCVDGNFYCFSHFGEKVWTFSSSGPIFSSPCVSPFSRDIFFGSHDRFIYCCNREGIVLWKFETTSTVYATPFVFCSPKLDSRTFLVATSTDGRIWILNAKTGVAEGRGQLPGEVFSSPIAWGSTIVVGCRNNYLYCLDLCLSKANKIL
ncbi:beta-alanine-activating enzyme isoform X1 [Pantherophis guttatus]|uniref:Beta-alanine-activating enzyme n=2 Tax=Pantherophis guttatus TaxID=94885 RepID=A0A6P9BGB7_PANGU|nr:beta-alanine-activating enzyme isoform X1 [Pantherophis guttatus]XP_034267277.1 beta-alanine-activating enzyme isoform X1 [Pantherophis guttatus]XP_060546831.1 beta-alanine-activating enzyme isoform X1 [Pantherophis guttatus]XP_060546832.1 beta-alanine-activating enzyme isoform X1 [Pantherophis guttatus]